MYFIKMKFSNDQGMAKVEINETCDEMRYRSSYPNYNFNPVKTEVRDFVMVLEDGHWIQKCDHSSDPEIGVEKLALIDMGCEFKEEAIALLSEEEWEYDVQIEYSDFWSDIHKLFDEDVHYLRTVKK